MSRARELELKRKHLQAAAALQRAQLGLQAWQLRDRLEGGLRLARLARTALALWRRHRAGYSSTDAR